MHIKIKRLKDWLHLNVKQPFKRSLLAQKVRIRECLFVKDYNDFDFHQIPIIIINFNRLDCLRQQIETFERLGYRNLYIIDNNSSYPPLLEYYGQLPYHIFRLKENVGHLAMWHTDIYRQFKDQYYILTDSDVVLTEDCPRDFAERLYGIMRKYHAFKVGPALKIDDLPDKYIDKAKVIGWEKQFWRKECELEKDLYKAPIDTTLALYRPNAKWGTGCPGMSIRAGGELEARHLPWYEDSKHLTEESLYYRRTCNSSASWVNKIDEYEEKNRMQNSDTGTSL